MTLAIPTGIFEHVSPFPIHLIIYNLWAENKICCPLGHSPQPGWIHKEGLWSMRHQNGWDSLNNSEFVQGLSSSKANVFCFIVIATNDLYRSSPT